jgi:hypothetical protein
MREDSKNMTDEEWEFSYEDYMFVFSEETIAPEIYPGSKTRKVTRQNVEEYIELQCKHHLNRAKSQL